jgi:hypothetical protein
VTLPVAAEIETIFRVVPPERRRELLQLSLLK